MIDLHWILGHPLRMQREQLYDIKFLRQKLYSFSWIVTDGKVKFLSPELSLSQLQGEESYPPGIQGPEKVCFLEHYFKDRTIVLEEKMPCKHQELRPMHLGRRGDKN